MWIKEKIKNFLLQQPSKAHYKWVLKNWMPLFDDFKASNQVLNTRRFRQQLRTLEMDPPENKRVLVISPHHDDAFFGAMGTLERMHLRGCHIKYVMVAEYKENSRSEVDTICQHHDTVPLHLGHRILAIPKVEDKRLTDCITGYNPDIIMTTFLLDDHMDHRGVNRLLSLSLGNTTRCEVWSYQIYTSVIPNVVVDITDLIELKMEYLNKFKVVREGARNWAHIMRGMDAVNSMYLPRREQRY